MWCSLIARGAGETGKVSRLENELNVAKVCPCIFTMLIIVPQRSNFRGDTFT